MLVMVKYILLETISLTNLFKNIHHLGELCANSKRKRLPALYRLLLPKNAYGYKPCRGYCGNEGNRRGGENGKGRSPLPF
jgi:hypothetical protein